MIPKANPIIAPRNAAVIVVLGGAAFLAPANKKPTYAMHGVHKIRRRLIRLDDIGHIRRNNLSIHLLQGVPQSNDIAARRLRGTASRILGKFCLVYPQQELILLLETLGCS